MSTLTVLDTSSQPTVRSRRFWACWPSGRYALPACRSARWL